MIKKIYAEGDLPEGGPEAGWGVWMNIINIEHISKIFGEKVIFEDASFGIQQGDKIGIVGINGDRKSVV